MEENKIYDLCIVGAGMFGSAAARHASANPALKVCLVGPSEPKVEEMKDRSIFSSHYDEGRITRIADEDRACQELSKCSIGRYKELEKLSGIKFYTPVGCLFIAHKKAAYLQELLQSEEENFPMVDLSHKDIFIKRFPFIKLKQDELAYLDNNGAGYISPRRMVDAQKKVAELQNCDIFDCVVSDVKLDGNGIYQVETEKFLPKCIRAKRLLIATGAFIDTIKLSVLKPLNVKKYRRTVTLLNISTEEAERLSSMPSIIYRGKRDCSDVADRSAYILPPIKYPNGHYYLKIGYNGTDQEVEKLDDMKQWFLSDGDKRLIDLGSELLFEILTDLKYDSIKSSTCINCYTPTGLPYIDRVSPTLTIAVAGNGKGAKFSDEVGRIAANLCIYGIWDSKLPRTRFNVDFLNQ